MVLSDGAGGVLISMLPPIEGLEGRKNTSQRFEKAAHSKESSSQSA